MSRARRHRYETGSALLPILAAMLIMLITGITLSELYTASVIETVYNIESAQAQYLADAGLWWAAYQQTATTGAVSFGSGTFEVTRLGNAYTSTGTRGNGIRVEQASLVSTAPTTSGISVVPSEQTAQTISNKVMTIDLINGGSTPLELSTFDLTADRALPNLKRIKLDAASNTIWTEPSGISWPTGQVAFNTGSSANRTIAANSTMILEVTASTPVTSGAASYTMILTYAGGGSQTLAFTVTWP